MLPLLLLELYFSHSTDHNVSLSIIERGEHECLHESCFNAFGLLNGLRNDFGNVRVLLVKGTVDFRTDGRPLLNFLLLDGDCDMS